MSMERIDLAQDDGQLFDVVEVDLDTKAIRMMTDGPKTASNADAVMRFAIMRRASDYNFFTVVPAGKYKDGDKYEATS